MSLSEFQRALAELIASPARCLNARRNPAAALAEFALTSRERTRLIEMVNTDGMSVNCTLYRVNRLTPIYSVLPNTCRLLGERLGPELEAFAAASRHATLQYRWEAWRFGIWIQERIHAGFVLGGPVEDSIRFELAAFDARSAPLGSERRRGLVTLRYDPNDLFDADTDPAALRPLPAETTILLEASNQGLVVYRVSAEPAVRLAPSMP
jgi:hypothetical protein